MDILVGMSGGVDSSTAALLLKEAGHNVIGATMAIWGDKGMSVKINPSSHGACLGPDEKEDIESAAKVCKELGIEFHVFDCASKYDEIVLKNFRDEYLKGRTPNPCVWCNSLIKFDVLPYIAKENGLKFEKFATGHYARVEADENGRYLLKRGVNPHKDQSYFLYRLKQRQLENILLPLGGYTKEEIRAIASKAGLEVAEKPDSQDFYEGDYNELLGVSPKRGNIVDTDGKVLGEHEGVWNYTIGQRKGIGIAAPYPLYVIDIDAQKNIVYLGREEDNYKKSLKIVDLNWSYHPQTTEFDAWVKIRYNMPHKKAHVSICNEIADIEFYEPVNSVTNGQSCVIYDLEDKHLIGGGFIARN